MSSFRPIFFVIIAFSLIACGDDTDNHEAEVEQEVIPEDSDDTSEDTAPVCEYVTSTWDGDIALRNNLVVSLNATSPSGDIEQGTGNVLALDFQAVDSNCGDLLVTGFSLRTYWTDIGGTGWHPSWVGMSVDSELVYGIGVSGGVGGGKIAYPPIYEDFIVPAGKTVTAVFSATMEGASDGDTVTFGLYVDSLGVYDGETLAVLSNAGIDGSTLTF